MRMMMRATKLITFTMTLAMPGIAYAHSGHGATNGLIDGLLHPLLGMDHLIAMLLVGVLAYRIGGKALVALPAAFVTAMLVGGYLGATEIALPAIELGIALSVIALGAIIAADVRLPVAAAVTLTGFFAVFHGYAHGAEIPHDAGAVSYAVGFAMATALLHVAGIVVSYIVDRGLNTGSTRVIRIVGAGAGLAGLSFLPGIVS